MRLSFAFLCLFALLTNDTAEIADARASAVLDGGSYCVDLIATKGEPLHLFVANPTRRKTTAEMIWILDEKKEKKGLVAKGSDFARKLHVELNTALSDKRVPEGAKTIFRMLDRLLIEPNIPWREVYFPERWEPEANRVAGGN